MAEKKVQAQDTHREERQSYEPPKVESVQLSKEAAEALT